MRLKTIPATPFAMIRGYARMIGDTARSTVELTRTVMASVKSVEVVGEQAEFSLRPENLGDKALLLLALGKQNIGLGGDLEFEQDGNDLLLTVSVDTVLLDAKERRATGDLISQGRWRYSTQIRIALRNPEGEVPALPARRAPRRRTLAEDDE